MTADALFRTLESIPEPHVAPLGVEDEDVRTSIAYLTSAEAAESLLADPYWPKWGTPWWHMRLLDELGLGASIPAVAVENMVRAIDRMPVKIFPIHAHELPDGVDPYRHVSCHCALGSMYAVLTSAGADVDAALPWARPWCARHQMADGGLSCDSDAYLQANETPSSMVGTIAWLEAMLAVDREHTFVDRAASFLIERRLTQGSSTVFNASERVSAETWGALTFPRFYFYDVLRGLSALVTWAERRRRALPLAVVTPVVEHLARIAPDGVIRVARQAHAGRRTLTCAADGVWTRGHPTSSFGLLDRVSEIGAPSHALTRQWSETRRMLRTVALA
jgi:hypothetical protein